MTTPETGPLIVGSRVTVLAGRTDPVELELQPHLTVVAVLLGGYIVANTALINGRRFGPLARERLVAGW